MNSIVNNSPEYAGYARIRCTRAGRKVPYIYKCSAKRELLRQLGIDTDHYDTTIHPTHICNLCNTKLSWPCVSSMSVFKWTVHADSDCTVCQHFYTLRDGGRPKASTVRGRPQQPLTPSCLRHIHVLGIAKSCRLRGSSSNAQHPPVRPTMQKMCMCGR